MKRWDRGLALTACLFLLLVAGVNLLLWLPDAREEGRQYRVEANRVAEQIKRHGLSGVKLSDYETITAILPYSSFSGDAESFFQGSGADYMIREVSGDFYRIEYRTEQESENQSIRIVNLVLAGTGVFLFSVLLFVRQKVLKPFVSLREVPYELSKGNLILPVKENKNRFFGRFVWGLDLLREHLEEQKRCELEWQKERKTLVLSLSHDIKTPLSAIKLYAMAWQKGLYPEEKGRQEIAGKINQKADEIEQFVSQIVQASREDFLQFDVVNGEFYCSELLDELKQYYEDKLAFFHIPFEVATYSDCLLRGDRDRSVEVLQNIVENAVKYGDGNELCIEMDREEDCQLVTVVNSGCQLQEHELPHIFESFWRGSNVGNNSGSGLGLSICRQLMRKMDGEVYAEIEGNRMRVTVVFRML